MAWHCSFDGKLILMESNTNTGTLLNIYISRMCACVVLSNALRCAINGFMKFCCGIRFIANSEQTKGNRAAFEPHQNTFQHELTAISLIKFNGVMFQLFCTAVTIVMQIQLVEQNWMLVSRPILKCWPRIVFEYSQVNKCWLTSLQLLASTSTVDNRKSLWNTQHFGFKLQNNCVE